MRGFAYAPVTCVYAGLLTWLFIVLSFRVIARRRSGKLAIGVAGNPGLERAVRVHANFAEYVPLALLLLLLTEFAGYPAWLVHLAGIALVAGRLSHAWGVSRDPENFRFRVAGMMMTFGVLGTLATLLVIVAAVRLF